MAGAVIMDLLKSVAEKHEEVASREALLSNLVTAVSAASSLELSIADSIQDEPAAGIKGAEK